MYYILLLCNCVICINCHLGLSCVNNVFCYSLPGIGGQSYVDTANNNNNNKLCPSLAKFNFINVFVFDVRNMHKCMYIFSANFRQKLTHIFIIIIVIIGIRTIAFCVTFPTSDSIW